MVLLSSLHPVATTSSLAPCCCWGLMGSIITRGTWEPSSLQQSTGPSPQAAVLAKRQQRPFLLKPVLANAALRQQCRLLRVLCATEMENEFIFSLFFPAPPVKVVFIFIRFILMAPGECCADTQNKSQCRGRTGRVTGEFFRKVTTSEQA